MIVTTDFSIMSLKTRVTLTLKRDIDDAGAMQACANALKGYLCKVSRREQRLVTLLIDLRNCANFTMKHVLVTVRILVAEVAALADHVQASAVILRPNARTDVLRRAFESLYRAERPLSICTDEDAALAFFGDHEPTTPPTPTHQSATSATPCLARAAFAPPS